MFLECYPEPDYVWIAFDPAVHREQDCTEAVFLRSNRWMLNLYWFHELDTSYSLVGDTLIDNIAESDASRLEFVQSFETLVFEPLVGLTFADLATSGVPTHSNTADYNLLLQSGLYVGIEDAWYSGELQLTAPAFDDLMAYVTGFVADWDAANTIRADVIAILEDLITTAQAEAAAE